MIQKDRPLGELERAVMAVLWEKAPVTVWDVSEALADRGLAYTTFMTTLDRLYKKGLLEREKRSHAYSYAPVLDREAYERRMVASVLESLPATSQEAILSGFLDFAETDVGTLDALEQLIAERRRKQGP